MSHIIQHFGMGALGVQAIMAWIATINMLLAWTIHYDVIQLEIPILPTQQDEQKTYW